MHKPTTVKNRTANAILEYTYGVISNMLRMANLDKSTTVTDDEVSNFLSNAAWAIQSTHHTILNVLPGAAIFGRDMLFDTPYVVNWTEVGLQHQARVDKDTIRLNAKQLEHDYVLGDNRLIMKDGILRKAEDKYIGPYCIIQVYTNGTIRIQRGNISKRLNIKRIVPYFEE